MWSVSALTIGRANLAASALPNQALALFAGGDSNGMPLSVSLQPTR